MISPLIPFRVAAENIPGWATGQLVRHGAILRDVNTGRIVAHLQETGLLNQAVSTGTGMIGSAANPASGVASIFTVVQNEQIKSKLVNLENFMGSMQTMQLATLGTSVVGIGVTMASTAIILDRIKQLDKSVKQMESKIDAMPAKWQEMQVHRTLVDLQTDLERLDESMHRPDRDQVLSNVEEKLNYGFNHFADGVRTLTGESTIDADQLRILLGALSICAGAQFKALLYLDHKGAAQQRTTLQNRVIEGLTWHIPRDVLEDKLGSNSQQAADIAADASELRIRLAGRPQILETLISGNIHGRDYIEQSEHEAEEPLLLLPVPQET